MTKIQMNRCPECDNENWALAVAYGECYLCGYKATIEDVKNKRGSCWVVDEKWEV